MLNKLGFFKQYHSLCPLHGDNTQGETAIREYYDKQGVDFSLVKLGGSTLGLTYQIEIKGIGRYFLKSHILAQPYRTALINEFNLLKQLYSDKIFLQLVELSNGQVFVVMDMLNKVDHLEPATVLSIIADYTQRLKGLNASYQFYDIADLINAAGEEISVLCHQHLLSPATVRTVERSLSYLTNKTAHKERCICHGDLCDKNIMQCGDTLCAIDWEDAFYGIVGYDYLNWLTFFNHRKYYTKKLFVNTVKTFVQDGEKYALSILLLILTIKSAISFYANTYKGNTLSIEERMCEILQILGEEQ